MYASVGEYRLALHETKTDDDSLIAADLKTVSEMLDGEMGRSFGLTESTARQFVIPAFAGRVYVQDMAAAPTLVRLRGGFGAAFATVAETDWEVWPPNAVDVGEPFTALDFRNAPHGDRLEITATWGWAAIPQGIKAATIHLTGILRLASPRASGTIGDLLGTGGESQISIPAQMIIKRLSAKYRRLSV